MRRCPVVECVENGAELLLLRLERVTLEQERALEQVALVDPDGPAAELPAVEGQVVLGRPGSPGRVLARTHRKIARNGRQQRLVLGDDAAERVVGRVPSLVLRIP